MNNADALAAVERHFRSANAEFQVDPHVQRVLDGHVVHAQQQYRGLSIYPHSVVIDIDADGRASASGDALLDVGDIDVVPQLSAEAAVSALYRHLRNGTGGICHTAHDPLFARGRYRPRVVSAFPTINRPTLLAPGPFDEPVQANLVIFRDTKELAWLVSSHVKGVADFTLVIRASGESDVLYCAAEAASACRANVYLFNAGEGASEVEFPRPLTDYPPGIRPANPFRAWLAAEQTIGNNVTMKLGNKDRFVRGVRDANGVLRFTPVPRSDDDKVVNAFFACNFMHDFFSLVGFDEEAGNFQQENFSLNGKAGDRLFVFVVSSAQGNANMRAQNDGQAAELTLGVWQNKDDKPPTAGHPTALDTQVIIHEYAHGVSQRLVGGQMKKSALLEPQSLALGEAWSDYFAITIQNFYRGAAPQYTFASFASKKARGARPHPYNAFVDDMRKFGTPPYDEQHGAGSIFAAALIKMHDDLAAQNIGPEVPWRLVVGSMKKLAANPNFLEARDKLLELAPPAIAGVIRAAFAKFGLGRNARTNGTSLKGFQADFTV